MNTLLVYMVKAAVYLAGFYLVYFIFLSRDTKYGRNRTYIILSVFAAFILPLVTVNINEQSGIYYFGKTLSEVLVTANGHKGQVVSGSGNGLSTSVIFFKIYIAGLILFSLKLLTDIINLVVLIVRNKKSNDHIIHFKGFNTAGFSAMGYVFINRSLGEVEADEIIRHEQNHLDHNHFLDILFIEVMKIFQWFNPFIYLFNRSLRAIHEYQADAGYLKSGIPVSSYQCLLLNHVFRSKVFNISNSFSNPTLIRKRMIMMLKEPSGNSTSLKTLLVIPVVILFLLAISACEKNINLSRSTNEISTPESPASQPIDIAKAPVNNEVKIVESVISLPPSPPLPPRSSPPVSQSIGSSAENMTKNVNAKTDTAIEEVPEKIFVVVEEMPRFPGGEKALMNFINDNIQYPEAAKDKGISGKITIRFAVMANGNVGQVKVLKGVDPDLDKEAIRIVQQLPAWEPGRQGGKPVSVWYMVPITFQLK